jgi:hypothetical protein
MYLKDFLALGGAATAKLEEEEADVAALRIYTSQAFKCINDPLVAAVRSPIHSLRPHSS